MDEITLFTAIQPPPPQNPDVIRRGARTRLAAAMDRPRFPRQRDRHRQWGRPWRGPFLLAAGTMAVCVAVAAAALVTMARVAGGTSLRMGAGGAQASTTAYVLKRVKNALAGQHLVFHGQTASDVGPSATWVYGSRSRFEEFTGNNCGQARPDGSCTHRGASQPYLAVGTALIGGKLTSAYVTYWDRKYSLTPVRWSPPASACSKASAVAMGGPPFGISDWPDFIQRTLDCGAATVTGHIRIGGAQTTKIAGAPVTVRLSPGMARSVGEKWARVQWALYVNPRTYLPVRVYGSTQTYGGPEPSFVSWSVTDVQWLPPTRANIARALVTIPPGFRQVASAARQ